LVIDGCVVGVLTRVILKKKHYLLGCFALIRLGIAGCILGGFCKNVVLMRYFNQNGIYSLSSILFDLVFSLIFALIVNLIYDALKKNNCFNSL